MAAVFTQNVCIGRNKNRFSNNQGSVKAPSNGNLDPAETAKFALYGAWTGWLPSQKETVKITYKSAKFLRPNTCRL